MGERNKRKVVIGLGSTMWGPGGILSSANEVPPTAATDNSHF